MGEERVDWSELKDGIDPSRSSVVVEKCKEEEDNCLSS